MNIDYWIAQAMIYQGGRFVQALGAAFKVADPENKERLRGAFPHYFAQYLKLAEQLKREDDAKP